MPIITIISDRKADDFYIGILKGQILSACKQANIIELGLNIGLHSIPKAALILKNAYKNFPDNTIHIIGVASDIPENGYFLLVKSFNQYFLSADNGLFSLVFEKDQIEQIIKISKQVENGYHIPSISIFARIAAELTLGKKPEQLGEITDRYKQLIGLNPVTGPGFILGNVIYSDSYGNAITNIKADLFNETRNSRDFKIFAGSAGNIIQKISTSYTEIESGEILAIFNSFGLLEIAMNKGEIYKLLSFNTSTKIRVEFYD